MPRPYDHDAYMAQLRRADTRGALAILAIAVALLGVGVLIGHFVW